jgi:hypothetical protein
MMKQIPLWKKLGLLAAIVLVAIGVCWITHHLKTPASVNTDVVSEDREPAPVSPMVSVPVQSQLGKLAKGPPMQDMLLCGQKLKITGEFQSNPDTDAWKEQRQKITQATGDRIFDKDFGRVYDSLVLAMSTMELKVNNMERTSGYIQATGNALPPSESKAVYREALNDWCRQKGYDSNVFDQKYNTLIIDVKTEMEQAYSQYTKKIQKSLTFQLVKMNDKQTKVKLRFSDVYYPPQVESYYKIVWQAVDKQIFVDQNIEGKVESRTEPITLSAPVNEKEKSAVVPIPAPASNP